MNSFEMMVDYLENRESQFVNKALMSDTELENESLAFVESTLLNGYTITDRATYSKVGVMKRVS